MKKNLLLTFLLLLCSQISWAEITSKYVLLLRHSQQTLTGDEAAVLSWFNSAHSSDGKVVYANYLGTSGYTLNKDVTKVVWVHLDDTYTDNVVTAQGYINKDVSGAVAIPDAARTELKNYVLAGGNLYLSKYATQLVATIGRTTFGPNLVNVANDAGKKGINPEIGKKYSVFDHQNHPVFKDLVKGTKTDDGVSHAYYDLAASTYSGTGLKWDFNAFKPDRSEDPYRIVDFEIMHNAIVLGAWEHVVDYACAGLIEFLPIVNKTSVDDHFQGRIIANGMGGYDWNNPHENNNIQQLTINILTYLGTEKTHKVAYVLPNDGNEYVDPDDEATALQWFKDEIVEKGKGTVIHPSALADLDPTEYTTIWIHIDRDLGAATGDWGDIDNEGYKPLLTRYVKNGGNLLLTKHAVQLVRATKGINRCDDEHLSWENGAAEGDHVGIKDNEDPWVINPVIGAGWTGSGYVRYTEAVNDAVSSFDVGTMWDNKNNALYFNLKSEINHPIRVTGADTKYLVYHICGRGVKEDHNNLWKFGDNTDDHITAFQNDYKCTVLGQWGHKSQLNNAAIVQFNKTGDWNANAWEGKILCIGLGAYEWQPSNSDGSARDDENPYLNNIKQLTYNALNLLDDPETQDVHYEVTYGGVTYELHTIGLLHYAKIKSADANLQVYDLTKSNGKIANGTITVEAATGQTYYVNGEAQSGTRDFEAATYNITNIAADAFTNCTNLAYADLMAFQGVVPSDIRDCFHAHTLIYLPREEVWNIDKTAAYGTNIINTMWNSSAKTEVVKVCNDLQVWDNTAGSGDNSTGWFYYWWANKYPFTAKAVSFTRTFTANQKSTVALPFAISSGELSSFGAFYRFDRIVDDDKAKFYPVYATEAYKPYMIIPGEMSATEHKISISAVNKEIQTFDFVNDYGEGGITWNSSTAKYNMRTSCPVQYYAEDGDRGANFIAEYRQQTFSGAEGQGIYAYRDGTYQTTSGIIYADPYRGYVKLTNSSPSGARVLQILFEDEEVTGITNLETINADKDSYYTLSGVKVANPTRGIYLKNGKKVIVK